MPPIDEKYLSELRASGLHVSHPIGAFLDGVWVCKPKSTPGHNISNFSDGYISIGDEPDCPETDAPMLKFFFLNDKWQVHGQDCVGTIGPGDFTDEWSTPEEAVRDILDFYFGDPARMARRAEEEAKADDRFEAWRESKS